MDKKAFNDLYKLMRETSKLQTCSSKNCSDLKIKLMNDKYKSEKNEKKKDKLLYNYNKCILNNCKKIKVVFNKLPKSTPDYDKLHKMIGELDNFYKLKDITKEQHEIYVKNIEKLMTTISKQ